MKIPFYFLRNQNSISSSKFIKKNFPAKKISNINCSSFKLSNFDNNNDVDSFKQAAPPLLYGKQVFTKTDAMQKNSTAISSSIASTTLFFCAKNHSKITTVLCSLCTNFFWRYFHTSFLFKVISTQKLHHNYYTWLNIFKRILSAKTMEQFLLKSDANKKLKLNDGKDKSNSNALTNISTPLSSISLNNMMTPNKNSKKVLKIIVEGNIGSGKTTFLSIFSKNCSKFVNNPMIIPEPVDLWRDVAGVNIFQLLADDPERWSFTFQSYVQLTMLKLHEMIPNDGNIKVMERSIFSARYCFVENLFRKQLISDCEYFVLDEWFKNCYPNVSVDLIIYLRTDPDVVFERIQKRGRPEESKISLDYLRTLHGLHEDWLVKEKFPLPAPVITIDANIPLDKIMSIYEEKTGGILENYKIISK